MPVSLQCFDLGTEEIERKMRMSLAYLGIVIGPAVMTLGKEVDRVHLGRPKRCHKPLGIELGSDIRYVLRGVKIDMDLAEGEGKHSRSQLPSVTALVHRP